MSTTTTALPSTARHALASFPPAWPRAQPPLCAENTPLPARRARPLPACCCLGALLAGSAFAQDTRFDEEALYRLQEETRPAAAAYELNTLTLPAIGDDSAAPALAAGRPAGVATGYAATQHIDVTRWLTAPGAANRFGLSLGMSAPALPPAAPALAPLAGSALPVASLDLGVRWRSQLDGGRHLDVSAWARAPQTGYPSDALGMIWQTQQPAFGTRVEVQWASSKTRGLVPEFGAVGVQLQGNSRLVLRAKKGGPMLYYRAKF